MRDKREFHSILTTIHGKDASAYMALAGDFDFTRFVLHHIRIAVQGDAETVATLVLHVPQMIAGFPESLFETPIRRTALEDHLTREVAKAVSRVQSLTGVTGPDTIRFVNPGPHILPRSAFVVASDFVEARLSVCLPVKDGKVDADSARRIFFDLLPQIVTDAMIFCYQDAEQIQRFVQVMEDADEIRQSLMQQGLVGFVAEGSSPSPNGPALTIDESIRTEIGVPNAGTLNGLAIPSGVTVVLGDPLSGRHELVAALGDGVYNHIPEDGRSLIVTVPDAVRVCAEPGRPVRNVDLRAFLRDSQAAASVSTASASGHVSQMATSMEALQAGAQVLMYDESDSDAAFLAADARLRTVSGGHPGQAIPLSDRVRQMADEWRISIVIGAWACAGPFLASADRILWIENGVVRDVTDSARDVGFDAPDAQIHSLPELATETRRICPSSIDPSCGFDDARIEAPTPDTIQFGRSIIHLAGVPQVADESQAFTLGLILNYAKLHHLDTDRSLSEVLDLIDQELGMEGLDTLARDLRGNLARPRRFEIAAALNRLPTLRTVEPI